MNQDDAAAGTPAPSLLVAAGPWFLEGLATLLSATGAALITLQSTRGLGFPDPQRRALMLPFNMQPPVNTLFQYALALLIMFTAGAAYSRLLYRRMSPTARGLDLLAATTLLLVWWTSSSPGAALAALAGRALFAALLSRGVGRRLIENRPSLARLARWAPVGALLVAADLMSLTLPSGINAAVAGAPAWLLALTVAPFVLFVAEELLSPAALVWERRIGGVLVLAAIPYLTFVVAAAYFDFSVILGPVSDLLVGKDMPDRVVATYGFLLTYFLAGLFWIFRVTDLYIGLAVVNAIAYSVGYAVLFVWSLRRLGRLSLALATMTAVIAVHYFHLHIPMAWLPQSGFLRFGAMLPVFLLLQALADHPRSRRLEWAFAAVSVVALFWTMEVGVYLAAGLGGVLVRQLVFRQPGERRVFRVAGKLAAGVAVLLAVIFARILIRHGHAPVWADLLHFQRAFSAGLAMLPITSIQRWPLPIAIYLVTVFAMFRGPRWHQGDSWIFLALFGLAAMAYPLGKTGIYELARVMLPALLLATASVGYALAHREGLRIDVQGRTYNLAGAAAIAWLTVTALLPCLVYADVAHPLAAALTLESNGTKPIAHATPSWQAFIPTAGGRVLFQRDLDAIRALVPPEEGLPLLSKNDTLYYVFAQRGALHKNSFFPHFFFKADLDDVQAALLTSKIPYLFLDNSAFKVYENGIDPAIANTLWGQLSKRYRFLRHEGLLDLYERLPAPR